MNIDYLLETLDSLDPYDEDESGYIAELMFYYEHELEHYHDQN